MRSVVFGLLATVVVGCGGRVDGTADDGNSSSSSIPASCVYGSLGSVDGVVMKIASSGTSVFYAVAGDQNESSIGALSPDGTTRTLATSPNLWTTEMVPYEDGVAAVMLEDVGSVGTRGTEIRFWNGNGTPQTIEKVDGINGSFGGLTTDADVSLVWYKYDSTNGGTFETWNEGPIVSTAAPSDFIGGEFLTDGKSYFGVYGTSPQLNFGQLAVNGASELSFSSSDSAPGISNNLIGMDANSVYYTLQFPATEPDTLQPGQVLSADRSTGQTSDLGARAGIAYGQPVVLRQGGLYSLGGANLSSGPLVSRFDLASGETTVIVPSSALGANDLPVVMTQDRCGIVYTVQNSSTSTFFRVEP